MDKIKKQTKLDLVKIDVFEKDDQFWVTSLDVAEKFGKKHKSVLRAIKNLECSDDFARRNLAPSTRQTASGEEEYYIISRDGFSFLAMGFIGKEAARWKEKYRDLRQLPVRIGIAFLMDDGAGGKLKAPNFTREY